MHSKVEVLEKKESSYSEASFKNSLKNEQAEKKNKKKDKDDTDSDEEDKDLTDEEKDALDYQLQRAMDMVIAMSKMQSRANVSPTDALSMTDEKSDKK